MRRVGDPAQVAAVLDTLNRLLDAGTQADVARLARLAVDRLTDGPEGLAGVDEALLDRAIALYARACAAHPPDRIELADWVLAMSFGDPPVTVPLHAFAEALGDTGMEHIRSTVDATLAVSTPESAVKGEHAIAERLAEEIAEITGDVDRLVAAWSKLLPDVEISLKIVRALRAAGRHSEAIAHAARARGADPSRISELLAAGHDDEAWTLTRQLPAESAHLVVDVYRRHVDGLIAGRDTRNPAVNYARAAVALRRLRTLHRDAGTRDEFTAYLAGLVAEHGRKTRLMDEIRKARVALPKPPRQLRP
ncbi:hypothetical protein [Prauserella rugosa]|uniref:Uncharacterized protein n=1 Tax=Prauserella rugosa TaxID=43354 RepID=A0A660CJ47_9PSEU|nr:hypothetical protein [Prauserella rugosa]TWH21877.1 hypothetical protein JD82_03747 [Prauserella rugosa]